MVTVAGDYCRWKLVAVHGHEAFSWQVTPTDANGANWSISYLYDTGECTNDVNRRVAIVEASGEAGTYAEADVTVTDACGNSATIRLSETIGGVPE